MKETGRLYQEAKLTIEKRVSVRAFAIEGIP